MFDSRGDGGGYGGGGEELSPGAVDRLLGQRKGFLSAVSCRDTVCPENGQSRQTSNGQRRQAEASKNSAESKFPALPLPESRGSRYYVVVENQAYKCNAYS